MHTEKAENVNVMQSLYNQVSRGVECTIIPPGKENVLGWKTIKKKKKKRCVEQIWPNVICLFEAWCAAALQKRGDLLGHRRRCPGE